MCLAARFRQSDGELPETRRVNFHPLKKKKEKPRAFFGNNRPEPSSFLPGRYLERRATVALQFGRSHHLSSVQQPTGLRWRLLGFSSPFPKNRRLKGKSLHLNANLPRPKAPQIASHWALSLRTTRHNTIRQSWMQGRLPQFPCI